jgi:hypothetical protein
MKQAAYVYGTKVRVGKEYKTLLHQLAAATDGTTESAFKDAIISRLVTLGMTPPAGGAPEDNIDMLCHLTGRSQMAEAHFCIDCFAQWLGIEPVRKVDGEMWAPL